MKEGLSLKQEHLLGIGRKSDVYLLEADRVVKLFHAGVALDEVEAEFERHSVVYALGLPVPPVYGRCRFQGREGIIFGRAGETTLLQQTLRNPLRLYTTAASMARLHAQTLGFHTQALSPIKDLVRSMSRTVPQGTILPHQFDLLEGYLERLPEGDAVCHLDFHPDNIMVTSGTPLVIDWALAVRGDAAADVAFTSLLLTLGDPPPGTTALGLKLIAFFRERLFRHYRATLRRLTGMSDEGIRAWRLAILILRLGLWNLESERAYLAGAIGQELVALEPTP